MNANQLLEYLRNGAVLKSRWKFNTHKMQNILILPDASIIYIQQSTIDPLLRRRVLQYVEWSGGAKDYQVTVLGKLDKLETVILLKLLI